MLQAAQSSWSTSHGARGGYPGKMASHVAPTLGRMPHMALALASPGPTLHMMLIGAACNVCPRLAGVCTTFGTVPELLG